MVPIVTPKNRFIAARNPTSGGEVRMAVPVEQNRDGQKGEAHRRRQPFAFVHDERHELIDHAPCRHTCKVVVPA